MKLITNSIDKENLQTSLSHAAVLRVEMASSDSAKLNCQPSKEESTAEKLVMEKVSKITCLSNGIHNKIGTPNKCNGNMNGYYDDISDDDYQLVLESSSDEYESPSKKIDDENISAPQIVQEIEDLLGINASSMDIEDELEKELVNVDNAEPISLNGKDEGNLTNGEVSNNVPQEIQDVFEERGENTSDKVVENDCQKNDKEEEAQSEIIKPSEAIECDSSSNINVVFDEVEIRSDNVDAPDTEFSVVTKQVIESNEAADSIDSITKSSQSIEVDCKVGSTTEINVFKEESEKPDALVKEDKSNQNIAKGIANSDKYLERLNSSEPSEECNPLTLSSSLSENSIEWTVIDSVETSDDEFKLEKSADEIQSDVKETVENMVVDCGKQDEDTISTSSKPPEGEGLRKRAASAEEENAERKRPKLENDENNLVESTSQVLKRPSSNSTLEIDSKRSKSVSKPLPPLYKTTVNDSENCEIVTEKNKSAKSSVDCGSLNCTVSAERVGTETNIETIQSIDNNSEKLKKTENDHNKIVISEEVLTTQITTASDAECSADSSNSSKVAEQNPSLESNSTPGESDSQQSVKDENPTTIVDAVMEDCIQSSEVDSAPALLPISSEDCFEVVPEQSLLLQSKMSICDNEIGKGSVEHIKDFDTQTPGSAELDTKVSGGVKRNDEVSCDENKENLATASCSSPYKESDLKWVEILEPISKENEDKSLTKVEAKPKVHPNDPQLSVKQMDDSVKKPEKLVKDSTTPSNYLENNSRLDNTEPSSSHKVLEKPAKKTAGLHVKGGNVRSTKSPFDMLTKNMHQTKAEPKKISNLDLAIERVAAGETLPLLKRFHKDQLKKLTRSELEEAVVLKICEAVTDRSEIGQMRLRCQSLEQNNELWRKKALQFEKQNRELEMVLKRFLTETAQIKRENQNKVALPIKVTRSVGLQVVLASSMHGALVASKNRVCAETSLTEPVKIDKHPQQMSIKQKPLEREPVKQLEREPVKETVKSKTFTPPIQTPIFTRGRGRPAKSTQNPSPAPSPSPSRSSLLISPQPSPAKITPPSTSVKPAAPAKITTSSSKDLEVIDLTDKEEKSKTPPKNLLGGSIRVAPSTQVCYVQPNTTNTITQPMAAYIVQKQGQRQQYLVTTSSSSPSKNVGTTSSRPPPALALPVFQRGQIIPVQTTSQVAVRTTNTVTTSSRQVPQAMRVQPQVSVLEHPAPLPSAPMSSKKPGFKAPPPRPQLKIAKTVNGIMLSWSMHLNKDWSEMGSYQLYAYQESNQPPSTNLWKKVGDVKALPLPMACTLTQFIDGHKYHFAVRAVDVHGRIGPFSHPCTILLSK